MRERSVANARGQIECRSTNSIVKVNQQFRFDSSTERLTVSLYAFEYMGGKSCGIFDGPATPDPDANRSPESECCCTSGGGWRMPASLALRCADVKGC